MKTFEFTLIVPDIDDATADAVYGRCPDSSIGRSHGTMYVAFDREAMSLEAALDSAVADLRQLGIAPVRVEMDVREPAMALWGRRAVGRLLVEYHGAARPFSPAMPDEAALIRGTTCSTRSTSGSVNGCGTM